MDREQLILQMKTLLASSFSFYLKVHNYHWNVTGPNFAQYHDFFGDLYEEVWQSLDDTAEEIRKLGAFAPGSLSRYIEMSVIDDEVNIPDTKSMFIRLEQDNAKLALRFACTATRMGRYRPTSSAMGAPTRARKMSFGFHLRLVRSSGCALSEVAPTPQPRSMFLSAALPFWKMFR